MRVAVVACVLACSDPSSSPLAHPPAAGSGSGSGSTRPRSGFEDFDTTSPRVGEVAPAIDLRDTEDQRVTLADAVARGPVVVVSGSFSCPLFRMKVPRFEELARRWASKATVLFVYSEEAHPRAASNKRLQGFAAKVRSLDADHDGVITVAEYGSTGPRFMFDAFDVDHDGSVRSHEIIAAQRIDQFAEVDAPTTLGERIALARRFRAEVPGAIRVLIDPIDNPTAKTYGELPNFAYVIGTDGKVAFKQGWAAVKDVERALERITGQTPPAIATAPDLGLLAEAQQTGNPVLVRFSAPGCDACARMETTLADAAIQKALAGFAVVRLDVEHDPAWRLLEDLDLAATPAFAIVRDGKIVDRLQGPQTRDAVLAFLTRRP
ncbi:MAG: thioredoxin family protein [Kofleriaceae bacterium]